jgi:glycosyltransferase involved in cell wall biosynthesis
MKVCMFVYNNCKFDARVLKEAKSLAKAGYDVKIIAVLSKDTLPYEERDGFKIIRVVKDPLHYRILRKSKDFRVAGILKGGLTKVRSFLSSICENLHLSLRAYHRVKKKFIQIYREIEQTIKEKGVRRALREGLRDPANIPPMGWPFLLGFAIYRGSRKALYRCIRHPVRVVWSRYVRKGLHRAYRYHLMGVVRGFIYKMLRKFLMVFHKPLSYLDYYQRSLAIVREEPADIYHAHDLNTLPVAYLAVRRYGGKLVYDSHELYTETSNLSRAERIVSRLTERFLIRRCHAVITVNDSIARELKARYKIQRPTVIMNCPMLPSHSCKSNLLREKLGLSEKEPLVLYQGGFSHHRGLENLLTAIALVPRGKLVMMGWGRLEEDLRTIAQAKGLMNNRVFFLPPVPQDELLLWTSSADAGVIPYRNVGLNNYFSLPNKLFEYIVAGIPVVASDFPELRRVIEEFKVGCTFNPDDPKDIARAISWVFEDEKRLVELKENARRAAAVLNWENEEKKLLELYRKLLP